MIKKVFFVIGGLVLLAIIAGAIFAYNAYVKYPDISQYEDLKDPHISDKADQKVIATTGEGNPDDVASNAISKLYKVYFSLSEVDKTRLVVPRGRWEFITEGDTSNLKGELALPVPDSIESIPAGSDVELKTWQYGEVAEILHIGSYDSETESVEKLKMFIDEQGYEITGPQEEEYLRGPTIIGEGNPDNYATIIRYRVVKQGEDVVESDINN